MPIERHPDIIASRLEDAAHFPGGHATELVTPVSEAQIAAILRNASSVLPVGAQSSLTGGATPMGELAIEGIYPLGYIHMLTGASVRRVFARAAAHFHQLYVDNGVEDLASVTIELDGGIVGSVALGRIGAASHPSGGEIKLHIIGDAGALVLREACPDVGIYYRNPRATKNANEAKIIADHRAKVEGLADWQILQKSFDRMK